MTTLVRNMQYLFLCKPSQVRPFPVYPDWQEHKKLPIVLVQLALSSQGNVPLEHSSTSLKLKIIYMSEIS